jgi:O-antigen ligase
VVHSSEGALTPAVEDAGPLTQPPTANWRARDLTIATALIAVAMLGFDRKLAFEGLSTGTLAVVALSPIWIGSLRDFRFARGIMAIGLLTLFAGVVLVPFQGGRAFSLSVALCLLILFATALGGLGLLLWARTVTSLSTIAIVFGVARLIGQLPAIPSSRDPWKFEIAIPLAIILLAWAIRAPGIRLTILSLAGIGLASIALDYRSFFGFCLLAIVLVVWQDRKKKSVKPLSKASTAVLIAVTLSALYAIGSSLLLDGYLGSAAQERTVAGVEQSGNVLIGGRPEWAGTLALMSEHPLGFGPGTRLTSDDIWTVKSGMASVGVDPNDRFRDEFMFGSRIKLHSVAADLWLGFGLMGIVFSLALLGTIFYLVLDQLERRIGTGLGFLMAVISVWAILFNPLSPSIYYAMFTLALLIPLTIRKSAVPAREVTAGRHVSSGHTHPQYEN